VNLQQVDLNLLVFLDALLREKNVTRAAEQLNMSQPATSAALARLRKVLGDELLVRQGRNLQLTPRGESLIDPVREVIAIIEQSIVRPPSFDPAHDERTFTVNASDYVGVTLVRPLLARLSGLAATLRIDLTPLSERYLTALQRDEVDIAILPDRLVDAGQLPDCSRLPVISDRFVGAVWNQHPAANGRLTVEVLHAYPYLQYRVPGGQRIWDDDLDQAGIARRVEATASSLSPCHSCWKERNSSRSSRRAWAVGPPGQRESCSSSRTCRSRRSTSRCTGTPAGTAIRGTRGCETRSVPCLAREQPTGACTGGNSAVAVDVVFHAGC
jgi:DNA-binding transcriptional LysR family regulator